MVIRMLVGTTYRMLYFYFINLFFSSSSFNFLLLFADHLLFGLSKNRMCNNV